MKLKSGYVKCVDYAKIIMENPVYLKLLQLLIMQQKSFMEGKTFISQI